MPTLIFGLVVLVLVLWAAGIFARADTAKLVRVLRPAGGIGSLALALFLGVRGELAVALPLGFFGAGLLGWMKFPAGFGQRVNRTPRQASRVRSAFLEMELDHDTGSMRGRILAGPHEGVALDALDVATLVGMLANIDDESRALLAAYLDRRKPSWRDNADGDAAAGQGPPTRTGKMTPEEAYQILGLEPGASAAEIGRAHRNLMKKLHPDQGGSTYLAARVNEAKDILLRRHR
jgi:DnaJ-like protein